MPLAPGARLGPYEIVTPLGAGGMGEVYKARDTRIERTVAVKVAKEAFEQRFRNEALVVAALNHPRICTLFDVGPDYLVMEYVDGARLRGPLSVGETLRLAGQIADALEHAHQHGVVHRDLKPSNVLVTRSGVKVLDFGIARRRSPGPAATDSQTTLSEEGTFLGTPQYMAPEQIEGGRGDERTDIFAFGLLVYEMLTGRRAFEGRSAAGAMAAVLEKDPAPITTLIPTTPPALADVVMTCLAKDPADRWQSVRELKHALAWASRAEVSPRAPRRARWLAAVAGAGVLGVALGFAFARARTLPVKPRPVRFQVVLPERASLSGAESIAVSPDGRKIALALRSAEGARLGVRSLDSLDLTWVPGGEGASLPFWSPDGTQIGFVAGFQSLRRIALSGGPPQTICTLPGFLEAASWGRGDVILLSARGRLYRVSARGGEPEPVGALSPGETSRGAPVLLPDGRHYLYLSVTSRLEDRAIYAGALDSDLRQKIVASPVGAAYSRTGHLLFVRGDTLMAQPFDVGRLELSGAPAPVVERIGLAIGPHYGGRAFFSASHDGVLAWRPAPLQDVVQLTWFDRAGRKLGTIGEPASYYWLTLSPDERNLVACRQEADVRNLWVFDLARGASRRLTFDAADNCGQAWSPDGTRLAFFSNRRGIREIYEKRVDGSGDDELRLASKDQPLNTEDWSPDGRFLAYNSPGPENPSDLFLLSMSGGERKVVPFLTGASVEQGAVFAPNSRWVAYWSNETGHSEVYVKGVSPQGIAGQGKWQVSKDGGVAPRWRRDGSELFYLKGTTIMAVAVETGGPTFAAGPPRPLFDVPVSESPPDRPYDVTRDGLRFVVNTPVQPREAIRVLVNWLP